jgi:molecular chaperone GrpE
MEDDDRQKTAGSGPFGQQPESAGKDPASRLEELENQLAAAREETRQAQDRCLRERADLENLKKRSARERAETVKFANESLIRDLLPVLDNLERAVEHAQGGGNGQPLVEGVALVLKSLRDILEKHGVTPIVAKGEPFDPNHHEAMAQVESREHEPNVVVEEHQRGYRLNERLLRPALVSVARPPDKVVKDEDRD